MPLFVPNGADFKLQIGSHRTVRPSNSIGTSVTGAAGAYGSYQSVLAGASVTEDCFGIAINIHTASASATVRHLLVTIGRDLAGGASFTDWLTDLNCANAGPYTSGGGIWYYFPMYIKAGTSIGVKGRGNTAFTFRCQVYLFGQPRKPDGIRAATKFQSFGVSGNVGTSITPGTTSEGAWTSLGTAAFSLWWWQMGYNTNDTTTSNRAIHADLGGGASGQQKILVTNLLTNTTTSEAQHSSLMTVGCTGLLVSGEEVWGRLQMSGTADTGTAMTAYGVG